MQMSKAELIEASHPIAGAHRRMARRTAESRFQMGRSSFTRLDQKPGANLRSHAVRFARIHVTPGPFLSARNQVIAPPSRGASHE